jgi:hypothetical protein
VKWLRSPAVWFPLALALLTTGGALLLRSDAVVHMSERDRSAYDDVNEFRFVFDALSATAGVGLFRFDLKADYTDLGRWTLAGLGVVGAALYLLAARQSLQRLWPAHSWPRGRTQLLVFFMAIVVAVPVGIIVAAIAGRPFATQDALLNAVTTVGGLGWASGELEGRTGAIAVLSLLAAAGWPVWLLWRRGTARGALGRAAAAFAAALLVGALLIAVLETPRGGGQRGNPGQTHPRQTYAERFGPALAQVCAAAGAGVQTERIGERSVSEGTKLVLAGVTLVGGLGGTPGGGMKWLVLAALVPAVFATRRSCASADSSPRLLRAALSVSGLLLLWTAVVALGLLVIEAQVGSRYAAAPTFADALVDASSAVNGAGLTSGLTAALTAPTLSSGIRLSVDLYQYGMVWMIAAMFIGRILPLIALARVARVPADGAPPLLPVI